MAMNVQKTLSMAAGAGYSLALGQECGFVNILTKADCWIKVVSSVNGESTTAPVATPAPGAGASATWIHLAASGETFTYDYSKGFNQSPTGFAGDRATTVLVWAIAAGDLIVNGR